VPVVGTVGNLNPIKGQDRLIRALRTVVDAVGEVAVPVVGAELDSQRDYADRLRRLRDEAGLRDAVQFVGWRSDVPELLSLFDLFVCPSLTESGPMVVLEAMAIGCPVVTTEVGLIPEHFTDEHAWIVPPDDEAALADAIVDALRSPDEQAARAERAREVVSERLSLSAAVERHREVYEALAGSAAGH
jgi:glycosyltransferase involved in cell wall biosynthesis